MKTAALALVVRQGKVLLLRRGLTAPTMPGYWGLPGGNVEEGEEPSAAALRELQEESGLRGTKATHIGSFPGQVTGFTCEVFRVDVPKDEAVILSFEHDAAEWVPPEEHHMPAPMGSVTRDVMKQVEITSRRPKNMRLIEAMAAEAHESWAQWMEYLYSKSTKNPDGSVTIPAASVERWNRQMDTAYDDLPEGEKESDREEARRYIRVIMGTPL